MRAKFGSLFMVLGIVLLLGAASLFVYNEREAQKAEKSTQELLPLLIQQIEEDNLNDSSDEADAPLAGLDLPTAYLEPKDFVMKELEIDGNDYIGYLSIPRLGLDLPIMSQWDYPSLKIAPCRYYGTVKGEDLVLMAHNYDKHFGRLSELSEGDSIIFVDIKGDVTAYEVVARDVLAATAIEEMTSGTYDLTLFTCTYSGQDRVTVFCDKISNK